MQQTLKRSRVSPPAFELFPRHRIPRDVRIVDVGNLEFATTGRLQRANDVVDRLVVQVNANHGVFRLRLRRLLVDVKHAAAVESRNAKSLWIGNLLENDLRAATLRFISSYRRANVSLDDVVAEHDTKRTAGREVFD